MKSLLFDIFTCGCGFDFENGPQEVSTFRRILPQFLASLTQFLVSWSMGLILAIASIVVPSVIGQSGNLNPDETLHMTIEEASWLGKFYFLLKSRGIYSMN